MNKPAAYVVGAAVLAALMIARCTSPETPAAPAPPPQAAQEARQSPEAFRAELMLTLGTQLAKDKGRRVLYVHRNAPAITLYDTEATHPACTLNGKPMRIAEAGTGGFTCYRFTAGTVALRIDADNFATFPEDAFLAR